MKSHKFEVNSIMMNRLIASFVCIGLAFSTLIACKQSDNNTATSQEVLPFSVGKISSIYIYTDGFYSENPIKDSLFYYLNQPYLLTPNMSPAIDLVQYDFNQFAKGNSPTANNLVVANLEEDSAISKYIKQQINPESLENALADKDMALIRVRDVNAIPQQVFYLVSNGPVAFTPLLKHQIQDYISTIIEQTTILDNTRLLTNFNKRRNLTIENQIQDKFGINIWVPREYNVIIEDDDFIWLLRETDDLYSNIVIYRPGESNSSDFENQVIQYRDEFGAYITTTRDSSRMTTQVSKKPIPIQREIEVNGQNMLETRGLWRMINDRLGGGFVNYTFTNKRGEVITVDGFVYYNDDDKRRQMRDIDALLSTIEIE